MIKRTIMAAIMACAAGAAPAYAQDQGDMPTTCPDVRTQLGMTMCAHRAFLAADTDLNALWPAVVAEMRRRDRAAQSDRVQGRPGYYQAILRAQRAWISWRDAQCVVAGYEARGGSMEPMLIAQCKEQLTRQRVEQLTAQLEDRN